MFEEENVSDELIELLKKSKGYNLDIGTEKDPRNYSYKEFLNEIDNCHIEMITPNDLIGFNSPEAEK